MLEKKTSKGFYMLPKSIIQINLSLKIKIDSIH